MTACTWFAQFHPCLIVGGERWGWWASDRHRLHRIPPAHLEWLRETVTASDEAVHLTFDGGVPEAWEYNGSVDTTMAWLARSARLRILSIPRRDHVQLVTADLQAIRVNRHYFSAAADHGASNWRGSAPGRPIFGYDLTGDLLAVIKPLTTTAPPSPALRPLPTPKSPPMQSER